MPTLSFQLPEAELAKLQAALNPQQFKSAIFQVVKRTTGHIVSTIRREVRERSTISKKWVDRVIKLQNPSGDPPEGRVTIKQEAISLGAFTFHGGKRTPISVQMLRDRPPLIITHGFKAIMASGHMGIFTRARLTAPRIGKNGRPIGKSGFAGRLPVVELRGLTVNGLVNIPKVFSDIVSDTQEYMAQQADGQLSRFASQQPITDEA